MKNKKETIEYQWKNLIPIFKDLKPYSTNVIFDDDLILISPILSDIITYGIIIDNNDSELIDKCTFKYPDINSFNAKFKVTKSKINIKNYGLELINNDQEDPLIIPKLNQLTIDDFKSSIKSRLKNLGIDYEVFLSISDDEFMDIYEKYPDFTEKINKKEDICLVCDHKIMIISKPFLGDVKKCTFTGVKIIEIDSTDTFVALFKQKTDNLEIYTMCRFLDLF